MRERVFVSVNYVSFQRIISAPKLRCTRELFNIINIFFLYSVAVVVVGIVCLRCTYTVHTRYTIGYIDEQKVIMLNAFIVIDRYGTDIIIMHGIKIILNQEKKNCFLSHSLEIIIVHVVCAMLFACCNKLICHVYLRVLYALVHLPYVHPFPTCTDELN